MPNLAFEILGVEPVIRGVIPLLQFTLRISNTPADERCTAIFLHTQVQIGCPQRTYSPGEQEKLVELFGPPDRWGESLSNRLWCHIDVTTDEFSGTKNLELLLPCTFDLNVATAKYFYALDDGEVSLLFLFSGSVFYVSHGRTLVGKIPWDRECTFRMPISMWKQLMDHHFPGVSCMLLQREIFDRLYALKRQNTHATWDETIQYLLDLAPDKKETSVQPVRKREDEP